MNKRIYRIKTSEFKNLTSNKNLLTEQQELSLARYKNLLNIEPQKFLAHGQDIVLIIANGKYYITSKPCYQESIIKILESVNIAQDNIVVLRREHNKQSQELTSDELKVMLGIK